MPDQRGPQDRTLDEIIQWIVEELLKRGAVSRASPLGGEAQELCETVCAENCWDAAAICPKVLEHLARRAEASSRPSRPEPACLRKVGRFALLEEVGRGGAGVVYRAQDLSLAGRVVAVKHVLRSRVDFARLKGDADNLARLRHPNIVTVYDCFEDERGDLYIVMEYCPGGSLLERLKRDELVAHRQAAEWLEKVAGAVAHAHEQEIVHRDVKPSNILFDGDEPKVIDFGLAKQLDRAAARQVSTQTIVGTPSYMAPEQADPELTRHDPTPLQLIDVYALGATLYEVLTGRAPFRGDSIDETIHQVLHSDPTPPRALCLRLPRDLETICLKCLQKEPRKRYASAKELADDLRRFLAGDSIRARRAGWIERGVKWAKRNPGLALPSLAAILVLLMAAWAWYAAASRRAEAARLVRADLQEATRLRDQSKVAPAADRSRLLAAAQTAAQHAENLAGRDGGEALRREARTLVEELEGAAKDARMVEGLTQIRLRRRELRAGQANPSAADLAYAKAFREYGIDVETLWSAEATARIRTAPIAVELAAALDDWALLRLRRKEARPTDWQWLLDIARSADSDTWRDQARAALLKDDDKILKELAAQENIIAQPAPTLTLLGDALGNSDSEAAAAFLRRARQQYPDDFWINNNLAWHLHRLKDPPWDEIVGFYWVAQSLRPQDAEVCNNLGFALIGKAGRDKTVASLDQAIAVSQEALRLRPGYTLALHNLGAARLGKAVILDDGPLLDEAIATIREAVRHATEDSAWTYQNLGSALAQKGALDEAAAAYQEAIRHKTDFAEAHYGLAYVRLDQRDFPGAMAAYKEGARHNRDDSETHHHFGVALANKGFLDEAIAIQRDAIRLRPHHAEAHFQLGVALGKKGIHGEAVMALREAVRYKSNWPEAQRNLGYALQLTGADDEAIAVLREVVRQDPKFIQAHVELGHVLAKKKLHDEAIDAYRKAVSLKPNDADLLYNLGVTLYEKRRLDEAAEAYQKAIDAKKGHAEAHCNLGLVRRDQGRFAEALPLLRRGDELGSKDPAWIYSSKQWLRHCERLADLDMRLPALLRREIKPASPAEQVEFAVVCQQYRQLYRAAAELYEQALAETSELPRANRERAHYGAACAAAMAGAGRGQDTANLDEAARARWRHQARTWLKADLARLARQLAEGTEKAHKDVRRVLTRWDREPHLSGLRDEAILATLPEAERELCRDLWAEVDRILRQTRGRE